MSDHAAALENYIELQREFVDVITHGLGEDLQEECLVYYDDMKDRLASAFRGFCAAEDKLRERARHDAGVRDELCRINDKFLTEALSATRGFQMLVECALARAFPQARCETTPPLDAEPLLSLPSLTEVVQ